MEEIVVLLLFKLYVVFCGGQVAICIGAPKCLCSGKDVVKYLEIEYKGLCSGVNK